MALLQNFAAFELIFRKSKFSSTDEAFFPSLSSQNDRILKMSIPV